jgi:peptidoglycan/xylan/chitin deacetylase (PgdA/CDA1 family)
VYVEDPAAIARFEVVFTDNAFTGYISKTGLNPQFVVGWNRLQFSIDDCGVAGTGMTLADWGNATVVRFALFSQPGTTANLSIARFKWLQTRAALTFTWDDGRAGCYTNAMPILKQQGWASTLYVVTQLVGQPEYYLQGGGTVPDPITLDQLHGLQDAGWDISSHTVTHPDLSAATPAQQQYELETAKEWLLTNGFANGARFFATPYGKRNADTQKIAATLYENLRDGSASPDAGYETPLNRNWDVNTRYQLRFQEINSLNRTPLAQFRSWVDAAISAGTWLIVLGHNVDGPSGWLTPGLFQQYVDYVASRRDQIDVLTLSEYWDRRNQSFEEFSRTAGAFERL